MCLLSLLLLVNCCRASTWSRLAAELVGLDAAACFSARCGMHCAEATGPWLHAALVCCSAAVVWWVGAALAVGA
jgi:hypothetical protein